MSEPGRSFWAFPWVRRQFWRVFGSFVGWFLFTMALALLIQASRDVIGLGGACAEGGAFAIETHCPGGVAFMVPAVFIGLVAVAIAVVFGQGFGTSITDLAWPTLFGTLGVGFIVGIPSVGLVVGGLFLLMALVPLVLALRASAQRVFLGAFSVRGERFDEGRTPRYSVFGVRYNAAEETVSPTPGDWSLSLIVWIAAAALGYATGIAIYAF